MDCLQQIRSLFPIEYNPFHSGFGNKSSVSIIREGRERRNEIKREWQEKKGDKGERG